MGDLVVVFKMMPESAEVDFEAMKNEVKNVVKAPHELQGFQEEPIAFGLKALKVTVLMTDEAGGPDELEAQLAEIKDVSNVSVADMGRV